MDFKMECDQKNLKTTIDLIMRMKRKPELKRRTKGAFDGQILHPTNKMRFSRDKNWELTANPGW